MSTIKYAYGVIPSLIAIIFASFTSPLNVSAATTCPVRSVDLSRSITV